MAEVDTVIEVKNLTKWYGQTLAVDDVSFSISKGQIVGFLGPNGAGKTTTLRILTCFMPATSGSANVAGFDVFSQSMQVREIVGYLPEAVPLYGEMRVREYLHFRAKLRGLDVRRCSSRIDYVSQRCWLGDVIDRPIGQLSRGYRQRVGLSDAMLHDPQVLILDEPTVGLDPAQIRQIRELIKELGQDHTVLLSSHILPEVEAVCGHTIIIAAGRIVASGSPQQLRQKIRQQSKLIAEIRGPADQLVSAVKGLDGVKDVDVQGQDGWQRLTIEVAGEKDPREKIFELAANKGWALREMRLELESLEDFFVRVVAQQDQQR